MPLIVSTALLMEAGELRVMWGEGVSQFMISPQTSQASVEMFVLNLFVLSSLHPCTLKGVVV